MRAHSLFEKYETIIYDVSGIYSSGGKSRQIVRNSPNGDYFLVRIKYKVTYWEAPNLSHLLLTLRSVKANLAMLTSHNLNTIQVGYLNGGNKFVKLHSFLMLAKYQFFGFGCFVCMFRTLSKCASEYFKNEYVKIQSQIKSLTTQEHKLPLQNLTKYNKRPIFRYDP